MAKKVTTIPATRNRFTSIPILTTEKRKVAGYARVSTDQEEQLTSYENQVDYYTNFIANHADWAFVKIYTDEGITATNTRHREGFNSMIDDALAGKIDLIVTKSVSRFARNTVDTLTTVRKLKEKGVEIYFEKENIWTLDTKGELLITIMSSLAQEESRSISENTAWGRRKTFQDGKSSVAYSRFLGYDRGFVINKEEAETVKLIFQLFISGFSYYSIGKELQKRGIKTVTGNDKWGIVTIRSILSNEKYKGDALLQKQFTVDFLQKKKKKNEGEIPQYYVEGHHEAIIAPAIFDYVQAEIQKRYSEGKPYSGMNIFSGKIKCGECGHWYGSRVWHSNDKYRRVIYQCNHKYKDGCICKTPHFTEKEIHELFLSALDKLVEAKEQMLENLEELRKSVACTDELLTEQVTLTEEVAALEERLRRLIGFNARTATDQTEYEREYNSILEEGRYKQKVNRLDEISRAIQYAKIRSDSIGRFIDQLSELKEVPDAFDDKLWGGIVEAVTVYTKDNIVFTFLGGVEIPV